MNVIALVLLCVAASDDEYLGRLAYRAQTEKRYSWENYQKDKSNYLSLSEIDRRALVQANRLRQSITSGTPSMRIEQTAPATQPPRVYPELWDSPPYRPFYHYPGYYGNPYQFNYPSYPSFQYHVIIH
jgi:hypothetical protein